MDLPENSDISSSCRICLVAQTKVSTIESDKYLELYEFCIGLQLTKIENAPMEFCGQCSETLDKFSQFKTKCMNSEKWWNTTQFKEMQVKVETPNNYHEDTFQKSYNNEYLRTHKFEVKFEKIQSETQTSTVSVTKNYTEALGEVKNKVVKLKDKRRQLLKRKKAVELMCDHCGKLFRKEGFLKRHVAVCLSREKNKKNLRKEKEPVEFDCGICHYKSSQLEDVECHFRQHLTNNNLECKLCNFVGIDVAHMVFHRYEHCSTKTYKKKCPDCDFLSVARLKLQFHYRSVHLMKPGGLCCLCQISKTGYKKFKTHLLIHKTGGYTCDICGFTFSHRHRIIEHLKYVHGNKQYVCETCGVRLKSRQGLKVHIQSKHEPEKGIKCNHCDRVFKNPTSLKKHLKEKTFFCADCGKGFTYMFFLKQHERSHSEERNFSCDYCSLKFKSKSSLVAHLRCHTGYKPFKCEVCNKSFYQGVTLRRHYSVHTGVRTKKCSLCERSFHSKKLLDQHYSRKHNVVDNIIPQQ